MVPRAGEASTDKKGEDSKTDHRVSAIRNAQYGYPAGYFKIEHLGGHHPGRFPTPTLFKDKDGV